MIFISHDLSVVRVLCDRVLVMRQGEVVESGVRELFANPAQAYTRDLRSAIPLPDFDPDWAVRAQTKNSGKTNYKGEGK